MADGLFINVLYMILGLPVKVRSYSTKRIKDEVKLYIISEINYLNK